MQVQTGYLYHIKDELLYKINSIIEYLKNNNGSDYKLYNKLSNFWGSVQMNTYFLFEY